MRLNRLADLVEEWQGEAEFFRRHGRSGDASFAEYYAAQLAARLEEWWHEELTDHEAAAELGVTTGAIQKRRERGSLARSGASVRRCDLFIASEPETSRNGEPDVAAIRLTGEG